MDQSLRGANSPSAHSPPPLSALGWSAGFARAFASLGREDVVPGRVVAEHRNGWEVATGAGPSLASLPGRLRHEGTLPAVGDWVGLRRVADRGSIEAVLPRRTTLSRKSAGGRTDEQVLAANVDVAFLVTSLNSDLSARRLERFVALACEGGVRPVVVLTKADLHDDPDEAARSLAPLEVPVHIVSAPSARGLDALAPYLQRGSTVALIGSSGVGKSTLVNALAGDDLQRVLPIRGDDTGRHATTSRRLILLPSGAVAIDTPGLREVALWDAGEGLVTAFGDVESFAASCRFRDCAHAGEPGCAVQNAVASGDLPEERLADWAALHREQRSIEKRRDARAKIDERRRAKSIERSIRARHREEWD